MLHGPPEPSRSFERRNHHNAQLHNHTNRDDVVFVALFVIRDALVEYHKLANGKRNDRSNCLRQFKHYHYYRADNYDPFGNYRSHH